MALTVLNNISSLNAENALSNTQASLQKTLTQLSTGLKINSGSDDAAGLSIASGLTANIAALTQSQQNASNAIGMLQTADGALSQVTTLLNRAVTLATEGSTSGITASQATALQTEYSSIASEINQIGTNTNFNGQNVFSLGQTTADTGTVAALTGATVFAGAGETIAVSTNSGANIYTFTSTATSTVQDAISAINQNVAGANASLNATGHLVISSGDSTLAVTGTSTTVGAVAVTAATTASSANANIAFISDGTSTANTTITTAMSAVNSTLLGVTGNLLTTAGASAALTALAGAAGAINQVSQQRGTIGASVNRLTAASDVMSSQVTNLQSAANSIQNADIGTTVANMTQYNVLESTGMAALQQSNQAQQAVLKLVQ
ncbi:MAG: flagellin [Terracidiphilus sp.]